MYSSVPLFTTNEIRYCRESSVWPLLPIRTPISSPLNSTSSVFSVSSNLASMTTTIFIAWNTSWRNFLAWSSTDNFSSIILALITAGLELNPRNPVEPSSITSYSNLSLGTVKCLHASVTASLTVFAENSMNSLLFFSLYCFTILALAAKEPGFAFLL